MNYAVILAGGAGERFWPASTPPRTLTDVEREYVEGWLRAKYALP